MPHIIDSIRNANLGWLYYKKYFIEPLHAHDKKNDNTNIGRDTLTNRNQTITQRKLQNCSNSFEINSSHRFSLFTTYPGFLIGSGYTHEYGDGTDKDDAFKIGFFFDHITGFPCIPGHSIKGALRAAFPNHRKEKYVKEKSEFIVSLISEPKVKFEKYLNDNNISGVAYDEITFATLLGELIFEGKRPVSVKDGKFKEFVQMPLSRKDVFHDAFLFKRGKDDLFLSNDYITHHENPLKNPNPIQFLKILPNVGIQFQFDLKNNLLSPEEKKELFLTLILTLGLGAKTNVGYGQFTEEKTDKDSPGQKIGSATSSTEATLGEGDGNNHDTKVAMHIQTKMKKDSEWNGTVINAIGNKWKISILVDKQEVILQKAKEKCPEGLALNSTVKIKFNADYADPPNFKVLPIN